MSALSETHSLAGGGCSQESNGQRCSPVLKSMSLSSIRSSAIKDNSMTGGEPVKTTEAMTSTAAVMIDERHVWLFKCITLGFGIQDDDFVQRVEKYMSSGKALEFVNIFLAPNSPRALFALLSHGFPEEVRIVFDPAEVGDWPVKKVLFFLRTNAQNLAVSAEISQDIFYGQFGPHAIKSFHLILDEVYGPLLQKTKFPRGTAEDDEGVVLREVAKFSMTMADVVQTIDCRVHFNKVNHGVLHRCGKLDWGQVAQQGDLQHLEVDIAKQWISAAEREIAVEDLTVNSIDDLGPDVTLRHWRERLSHLNSLNEHFQSGETREVWRIWEKQLPHIAEIWDRLEFRLRESTLEATENVKHLSNLYKSFEALVNGTPGRISQDLLAIFAKTKMMRYMSKYLQDDECMTGLLVKVVNQIIARCKIYIAKRGFQPTEPAEPVRDPMSASEEESGPITVQMHRGFARTTSSSSSRASSAASRLQAFSRIGSAASAVSIDRARQIAVEDVEEKEPTKDDIWSQSCDVVLKKIQECIELTHICQVRYRDVKNDKMIATAVKDLPFAFDESYIFAKLVLFEQRLQKLDGFFKAFRLFELLSQQSDPKLQAICKTFFKATDVLKGRPYDVLDISVMSFDFDFDNICLVIAELEQQLQEYIDENFKCIESTEQALDLLSNLRALLQRDSLKQYLSAKYINVFTNFLHDLDVVSNLYETLKEDPPMFRDAPPVTGRIVWIRHLLRMIEEPMRKFQHHAALMISRDAKSIIKKYNQIAQAFVAYEVLWEKAWQNSVEAARLSMSASVLVIHPDDDKLYVNFDSALLQVIREAKCMRPLGIDVPSFVVDIMNREAQLKSHAARLKFFIEEYSLVKQMVVPDLQSLFKLAFDALDDKMRPALSKVTWSSINLEDFIQRIFDVLSKTREIISKARDLYDNRVMSNLSRICHMNLVRIPDSIVTTANFISAQKERVEAGAFQLDQTALQIETAVKDIIDLVLKFNPEHRAAILIEQAGQEVLSIVWNKLYLAVLSCFKVSFQKLKSRIQSSFAAGLLTLDHPFFRVEIELLPPQVKASPSIDDVQQAVNRTALAILRAMNVTPWKSMSEATRAKLFDISDKVLGSIEVVRGVLMLTGSIQSTRKKVEQHIQQFYAYDFLWTLDKKEQIDLFRSGDPGLEDFIARLSEYEELEKEILQIPNIVNIGPLCLSNEMVKFSLKAEVDSWKYAYTKELMHDADKQIQVTKSFFAGMRMQVHTKVRDLDEVRTVSATLQQIRLLETEVEHTFNLGEHYCQVVKEFGYRLSEEEEQMIANARSEWENLQSVARLAADRLFRTQENFRKDLVRALDAFVQEVAIFSKDFAENGPVFENLLPTEGVKRLQKFQTLYEIKAKKLFAFRQGEELFGLPRRGFAQLEKIKSDLLLLSNLYTLYIKYKHSIDFYMKIRFSELAPQMKKMKDEIQIYNENIDKIDKSLLLYAAFKEMKIGLRSLFEFIPILDDLVKSSMRPRHWREIMVASQTVLDPNSPSFCVQNLVDAQLQKWRFKIQDICANSEEEQVVEEKVEVIARQWHAASLSFKSHKQLGPVLFDLPALQVLIESFEEIQALLQSLAVSKHGLPFKDTIDEHVYQFSVFIELMEIWRDVQHVWWYVDVIFSSEDVGKQLPEEAQRFSNVNRIYVNMMLHAFSLRYVPLLHAKSEEFRNTLTLVMEDLEICEKHLAGYLGSKRDSFPRLYYISDKVLIEALSQASGLGSIQGGEILSLFANVTKLVLAQRLQESQHRMIESVQSEEAEVLEFKNPVKEAGVEVLLRDIENEMKTSLQALSWDAIRIMVPNLAILDIQTIASEYPCQACILAMQYWFTNMCESAFSITGDMADLRAASQKVSKLSDQFAMHLRGLQPRSARAKLEAMCVVNMMHQDIVKSLVKDFIKDKRSWEWQCQLKCSIDDQRSIYLETLMYKSPHTYEFVGCRKRLICTAQTNKCYIFLLHTIVSQQFAYLAGPSGCGKTETIHELGRMLGRFVLQFPCSAEVGYSSISNVISGIAQTGSWINLIDLSRLPPEKLSVMAQQLMSVLDSVREIGASRAPGRSYNKKIDRVATASSQFLSPPGIFCSDNIPLAAARANLPDNMRSCVRVLTVLEPDMQVVLFVKLWLACFSQADLLAAKLSTVYKTLASILSDKQRYNFDLRNALTVVEILAHKNKKTKVSFEDEISFAGKVVYDCNEPQMDEVDIPVLHLVVSDVLGIQKESNQRVESAGMVKRSPSIERTTSSNYRLPALIQAADPESMLGKVNTLLIKANLNLPVIRDKCMQAHEVAFVRNGLTFVGGSFTGKSLCCQTLLEAMSNGDVPFKTVYLNPVALGHKHLFGWYDHKSNEWTDGAFPVNWRRASRNDVTGTWLVLDGPINPTWIECLHTCLEDDQTFISANGDRIITKTLNKLVFEVDKLLSASPASLSRTGIIYFPRSAINYKAMITAWLYKRRSTEAPSLELIFEKLVDPVIEFFQNEALSSSLQVNIPAQTEQFLKILESFLAESVLADEIPLREVIERYVLISLAWAFTGLLAFEDRKKVDVVLRQITSNMPDDSKSRTIIDNILVDTEEGLKMWTAAETLCEWTYPSIEKCGDSGRNRVPKFTVPTAGAITMCYLTKWMNDPRTAILVAGSRGVGKSTICSSVLESARSKTRVTGRLTLSLKATGQHLQNLIEGNVTKRQGNHYAPEPGKNLLLLIEDLNMPQKDQWGDQPCSEVLRNVLESGTLANLKKPGEVKFLDNSNFVASGCMRQKGTDFISERLRARCLVVIIPDPEVGSLIKTFEQIVFSRNRLFPAVAYETKDAFVHAYAGAIKLVAELKEELMPCRRFYHWDFTLQSIARLCQAILAQPPDAEMMGSDKLFASFFCHECERELCDQLPAEQKPVFYNKLEKVCKNELNIDPQALSKYRRLLWTDFPRRRGNTNNDNEDSRSQASFSFPSEEDVKDSKLSPVQNESEIISAAMHWLQQHNTSCKERPPLELRIFSDLMLHLLRLVRVLRMERGNAILIGSPRIGKTSLVRLAVFIVELDLLTISATEALKVKFIQDVIRQGFTRAGLKSEEIVISVSIDHRVPAASLDTIFCAVRNADAQLIMPRGDFDQLVNSKEFLQSLDPAIVRSRGIEAVDMREIFRERVLKNVHFMLTFSMTLEECSELQVSFPGECVIDLWLPYERDTFEDIAADCIEDLNTRIDNHTIQIVIPDVKQQMSEELEERKNEDDSKGLGFVRAASDEGNEAEEAELAFQEAIKIQQEFRENMKHRIQLVIPRLMAELHLQLMKFNEEFAASTGHMVFVSAISFRSFCRRFKDIFMEKYEDLYDRRKRLGIAIKTISRCEVDLAKAQSEFAEEQAGGVDNAREFRESIMSSIKTRTTSIQKVKTKLAEYESDLIFTQDRLEDIQPKFAAAAELREREQAKVQRTLQFFKPAAASEIARLSPLPVAVGQIFDVALILLREKLNKIQMVETNTRTTFKDSWMHSVNLLRQPREYCDMLLELDLDTISPEQLELIQPYITSEELFPNRMQQIANGLAAPLATWVNAVVHYCAIIKESLDVMETTKSLTKSRAKLEQQVNELKQVIASGQDEVAVLRTQYDEAINRLQIDAERKEQKQLAINTASDIIVGLRVQQSRWSSAYSEYVEEVGKVAGDSSVASAFLTYCGLLDSTYRLRAEQEILMGMCKECNVMLNLPINCVDHLSSISERARWRSQGLQPVQSCSEDACLVKRSASWPLIIDPYGQCLAWLHNHFKENKEDMRFVQAKDDKIVQLIQTCVSYGRALYIHGLDSDFEHDLGEVYSEDIRSGFDRKTVTVGGEKVEFNASFQLYFSTRKKIPRFSSNFAARICVVNFASSLSVDAASESNQMSALELQLTGAILELANREQEMERRNIFQKEIDLQVRINGHQDRLVDALCRIEGNVIESLASLNEIKELRHEIGTIKKTRQTYAKEREKMDKNLVQYTKASVQCRRLLDAMFSISKLDPMYVVSVKMFLKLLSKVWNEIPRKVSDVDKIDYFIDHFRATIYSLVSASLMPKHKMTWQLLLALQVTSTRDIISQTDLQLLTNEPRYLNMEQLSEFVDRDDDSLQAREQRAQAIDFSRLEQQLSQFSWMSPRLIQGVYHLQTHWEIFGDDRLVVLMRNDPQEWKEFLSCPAPEREGQVPYFDNRSPQGFDEFRRLALIRFYRPDRFAAAVRGLLFRRLDPPLRQPSNMNIHDAYLKSDPYTPIVILTCQNLNATRIIKNAAHSKVIQSQSISLGNVTQREVARKMMLTGPGLGMWLILENGHLDSSYLSVIPSTIEHMDFSDEHFRLFILAEATPSFPISLLDISLRQYAEPALGLKAKFTASLSWIEQDTLESVATPDWMMLLYSMSFLNAWMLSRREFGHIGWCLQHEFHRNDLLECFNFMKSIIEINEKARSGHSRGDIPWPTVQNMYRDIVLGSAFEHGNDSAVLDTQLKRYMSSRIFSGDFHFGLDFPGPVGQDIQATIRVLQNREVEESADVFGLNSAVSRASDQATSNDILLSLGTVFSSSTTATLDIHLLGHEQDAVEIAKCILEDLPENLKTQRAPARVSSSPLSQGKQMKRPMYFFAAAEQRHLHYLLDTVRKDLHLLISSLKAGMHITPEQNHFARDLLTGITPKNWADLSFPIELLSQWFEHTKEAHSQVAVLVDPVGLKGSISLGHCFRPSAFLRYHLQHMCQLHSMPLESVQLSVKFGGPAESPSNDKTKEFLLTGLWLQGAGWDARALKLVASPYNAPKLVALPPARLIVEQRPSETAPIPVEGNQVLNFVAPLYASTPANVCKSAGDGLPITHALFLTDLPAQTLVLSSCAVYCMNDARPN